MWKSTRTAKKKSQSFRLLSKYVRVSRENSTDARMSKGSQVSHTSCSKSDLVLANLDCLDHFYFCTEVRKVSEM